MSVDLVQLGEDIGEAQATAEAALEVAEVASAEAMIAATAGEGEADHCGPGCPCRAENTELRAALALLDEKYNQDMEVIGKALDLLLSEGLEEEEPASEEEDAVEVISPEEEEVNGPESTTSESSAERDAAAGASREPEPEPAKEEASPQAHQHHRRPARASGVHFARGRR